MAWLEQHPVAGTYQLVFRLGGSKFKRSLKTADRQEAAARLARVKENIRLVESGRLILPEHADPASFFLSDGQLNGKPKVAKRLLLSRLMECYRAALPVGSLESETLRITELHVRHFVRVLGVRKVLSELSLDDLQRYVLKRASEPGKRGKTVSVGTIRKEIATLTTLWNWALCTNRLPTASSWYERVTGRNPAIEIVNEWETWQGGQIALHVKIGREAAAARINPASSSLTIEPKSSSRPLRRLAVEVLEQPAQPLPALDLGEIAEGQRAIAASDLGRLASRPRQEHISHSLMWP